MRTLFIITADPKIQICPDFRSFSKCVATPKQHLTAIRVVGGQRFSLPSKVNAFPLMTNDSPSGADCLFVFGCFFSLRLLNEMRTVCQTTQSSNCQEVAQSLNFPKSKFLLCCSLNQFLVYTAFIY